MPWRCGRGTFATSSPPAHTLHRKYLQASDEMVKAVGRHALQSEKGAAGTELIQNQAEAVVHDATESGEVPVAAGTELLQNQVEAVVRGMMESGEIPGGRIELNQNEDDLQDFAAEFTAGRSS